MKRAIVVLLLALGLSACSWGSDGGDPSLPPVGALEDSFGAGFGSTYRADPNSDPRDPAAGDINPVDPTADPVGVP